MQASKPEIGVKIGHMDPLLVPAPGVDKNAPGKRASNCVVMNEWAAGYSRELAQRGTVVLQGMQRRLSALASMRAKLRLTWRSGALRDVADHIRTLQVHVARAFTAGEPDALFGRPAEAIRYMPLSQQAYANYLKDAKSNMTSHKVRNTVRFNGKDDKQARAALIAIIAKLREVLAAGETQGAGCARRPVCTCVRTYVCVYVRMHVRPRVCEYEYMYGGLYVRTYVRKYDAMYVNTYAQYIRLCVRVYVRMFGTCARMSVRTNVRMYVCACTNVCLYV